MMTSPHNATSPLRKKASKRLGSLRGSRVTRKASTGRPKREPTILIKRAYEPPAESDGYRVLVDRLWPRGTKKEELALDAWLKEVAPSDTLRRWFDHDPAHFAEFTKRYRLELQNPAVAEVLDSLAQRAKSRPLTLVYAARDQQNNNALVLQNEIARRLRPRSRRKTATQHRG